MGKGSTNDEIMDYFDLDPDLIPSQSAFCQRRRQISLSAFEYLFSEFSSSFPSTTDKFKDHCILACDGCHVVYATNSDIIEDYNKPRLIDYKGYNHMHLNGFVDVISKAFLDVVIQPGQQPDEREALHSMLDHFTPDDPQKYIITADRGYESYDLLFHCELKNLGYVFRVKSPVIPIVANAAFFKLGFLDKNAVALGRQFRELLPVLWMKADCIGPCPELNIEDLPEMLVLPENQFAVLINEAYYAEFDDEMQKHPEIRTIYIITDSEQAYREMIRPYEEKACYQLYRDYLDNFRINTGR